MLLLPHVWAAAFLRHRRAHADRRSHSQSVPAASMAPITAADQAFLQLLTQRKVLEESEALEAMDAVGSKLGASAPSTPAARATRARTCGPRSRI